MNSTAAQSLLNQLDRELWLVTACDGPRRGGLIATFVSNASLVPDLPRMLVALANHHFTRELVEASGTFGLHLLGAGHLEWVWRFGLVSGRGSDKLKGLRVEEAVTGSPLLMEALGWLDCRVEARLETGDRTAYLAEVLEARWNGGEPPLTFKRLLEWAPAERLAQLRAMRQRDMQIDAAAIRAWREQQRSSGPGLPADGAAG